jgi:peroxiredoxin
MTIKIGDRIPDAALYESLEFGDACPLPPLKVGVHDASKGKKIVIFGLPGAFTPTCSACISVNDGFVMAAWGRDEKAIGKIRFLGDGSADFAKKLGLDVDLTAHGMGVRMQRFSMLVDDGVVKQINVEAPGKFEVSGADKILQQLA